MNAPRFQCGHDEFVGFPEVRESRDRVALLVQIKETREDFIVAHLFTGCQQNVEKERTSRPVVDGRTAPGTTHIARTIAGTP
jgi:hypothetical protein